MWQVNRSYCVSDIIINDILAGPPVECTNKSSPYYSNLYKYQKKQFHNKLTFLIYIITLMFLRRQKCTRLQLHLTICTVKQRMYAQCRAIYQDKQHIGKHELSVRQKVVTRPTVNLGLFVRIYLDKQRIGKHELFVFIWTNSLKSILGYLPVSGRIDQSILGQLSVSGRIATAYLITLSHIVPFKIVLI